MTAAPEVVLVTAIARHNMVAPMNGLGTGDVQKAGYPKNEY